MSEAATRQKISAKAFASDFVSGASDEELQHKYCLSHGQMVRAVGLLMQKGELSPEAVGAREANLRARNASGAGGGPQSAAKKAVDLDTGLVLHCPACAAAVKREAGHCDYCHAALDFSLKGKTTTCPHCFATTPADGRFCIRCARPLTGLVQNGAVLEDRICPACKIPMKGKRIGDFSVIGCDGCNGLFVPNETFEAMQEDSSRVIVPAGRGARGQVEPETKRGYVPCPVCRNLMNRVNFERVSGVIVDTCKKDGLWFDADELGRVMDFIARGGLQEARKKKLEDSKLELELQKIRSEAGGSSAASFPGGTGYPGNDTPGIGVGIALGLIAGWLDW